MTALVVALVVALPTLALVTLAALFALSARRSDRLVTAIRAGEAWTYSAPRGRPSPLALAALAEAGGR